LQIHCCRIEQHPVQVLEPGVAGYLAEVIADDVVHGDNVAVPAWYQGDEGEVGQPSAQRWSIQRTECCGGLPQRCGEGDGDCLVLDPSHT
jgi:hypothetical protein